MTRSLLRGGLPTALALFACAAPVRAQFVKAFGGTTAEHARSVAVDGSGNVYISGAFSGTSIDFDPDNVVSGDTRSSSGGSTDAYVAKYSSTGVLQWVKPIGGANVEQGNDVAVDGSGNVYVAGGFQSASVDFDVDNSVAGDTKSAAGSFDGYLAKYNSSGVLQFVKTFGVAGGSTFGQGVGVDALGTVRVAGSFVGTNVDFDADNVVAGDTKTSNGSSDAYVATYDATGVLQALKAFGGTGFEQAWGVALDGSGNLYLSGSFNSSTDFDADNVVAGDTRSASSDQAFVARYNGSGVLQLLKTFGGASNSELAYSVAVDASGNIIASGNFNSTGVDFDEDNVVAGDTKGTNGSIDAYLVKYNSSGVLQFVKTIGGTTSDGSYNVAVDGSGHVYAAVWFSGTSVDFDQDNVVAGDTRTATSFDGALAKYNGLTGALQILKVVNGSGSDVTYGVAVDAAVNLYASGQFTGTNTDFDADNAGAFDLKTAAGSNDAYVLKYNSLGALPVELTGFTATVSGPHAHLAWTTESETDNAGFGVEHHAGDAWREVAFVAGRGTTRERTLYAHTASGLPPGRHRFRLRQVDLDGTARYGPTTEVTVWLDAAVLMTVRGTSVRLTVRASQQVRAEVFDVTGRRLAVLFDDEAAAGQTTSLETPGGLAPGVYLVRATGRGFTETARVVVR